jgi:hypothetical protein
VLKVVLNTITVINKKISARQLLYFVKWIYQFFFTTYLQPTFFCI